MGTDVPRLVAVHSTPAGTERSRRLQTVKRETMAGVERLVQALAASQTRVRHLYDSVPAMMHSTDAGGSLLSVSECWLTGLGYTREAVLGRNFADFLAPSSRERYLKLEPPAVAAEKSPEEFEYQMICGDGHVMYVVLSAVVERDPLGKMVQSMAVLVDVSQRKAMQFSLNATEANVGRDGKIAGVGGWSVDIDSGDMQWSDQMCRIHDVPPGIQPSVEEVLGLYDDPSRRVIERAVQESVRTRKSFEFELPLTTSKGRRIWVRTVGEAALRRGKLVRVFGASQDITARKLLDASLAEQHELLRVTLDSIGDAVISTDSNGVVQWLNPVAAQLTGWQVTDARGRPIDEVFNIIDDRTRHRAPSPVTRALADNCSVGLAEHTILVARDGSEYGIQDSAAPIRDMHGNTIGIVLVFHDVSEQRRLSKEISFRASHDPLTGLLNRSEFEARLTQALTGAKVENHVHALMFIDLDQFKLVNDACGHSAGDELLRNVSAIFQNVMRSRDTLARLGGDEFGVIMEHCTVAQARRAATQLCESMDNFRFVHEGRRFRVGTSIGLVPLDDRWPDVAALMQAADASCYAAKEAGRNRVHEWLDTDQTRKDRRGEMQWVTRIEDALDDGQFRLFGQIIVPCDGSAHGLNVEVLLRLLEPDGTIVTPAAFLPAAERFHMASRIDRWVVAAVIRTMGGRALDHVETVAINLSGHSICDRTFHRFVIRLIAELTFDPAKLCFEITETAAVTHMAEAAEFVTAMRKLGVRTALDDFGAGASSFGYLKHLPVDYLKIDGQFVRDMLEDRLDHTAVSCFRDVAGICGLKTIAEFVERKDVLAELRRIGVDYAQGFLIHRPEPLDLLLPVTASPGRPSAGG
jgi:diguanylate cyclase (GGDEF)-like protein/PAS domain S-box-containing protein